MKIKDVNIDLIEKMISAVPSEMDLQAITFKDNSIQLQFSADCSLIRKDEERTAARELYEFIQEYDKTYKKRNKLEG
ncbi:MAG: hypothetical protein IJT65_06060 [Eubacterium sp.]|nr:hypothetical protein [Eubacterium sp.]